MSDDAELDFIPVRSSGELDAMREAGRIVARTLEAVRLAAAPGVRLRELDELAQTCIREAGGTPSFLGYAPDWSDNPFSGALCLSPNEIVVHGRPTGQRLREGDLLSIDCGAIADGWHGDSAITVHIGETTEADVRLRTAAEEALAAGIAAARPGATLLDIATAIDAVARSYGYSQLPDHGGHGIGAEMHEEPFVPNTPMAGASDYRLEPGNTLAIEPMFHAGSSRYRLKKDGWSVATADKKRAAHVEHTILVTDAEAEILSRV